MKRFVVHLAAALSLGISLLVIAVVMGPTARAQPASARCEASDIIPHLHQPCIAIGAHTSPAGQRVDFSIDTPRATPFQLVGTEAPDALVTAPQSVRKFINQTAGTYTITQVPPPGFAGRWVACNGGGGNWAVDSVTDNSITLRVDPGAFVTCDFAAVRNELVVIKSASPADGTDFSFTDGAAGFVLDDANPDDADAVGSQVTRVVPLASSQTGPRSLTVTELVPAGWSAPTITCVESPDGPAGDVTTVVTTANAVTVDSDDLYAKTVTCTFRNSLAGAAAALITGAPACIESPQVQTDPAAAGLRVGAQFTGSDDGVRYLIVTGERSCSFNCDMGADANCDDVLGDYCPVELDLGRVRDVGICVASFAPAPPSASAAPTPPADSGLAHTGGETALANVGLGFVALGAAASAVATRRKRRST